MIHAKKIKLIQTIKLQNITKALHKKKHDYSA